MRATDFCSLHARIDPSAERLDQADDWAIAAVEEKLRCLRASREGNRQSCANEAPSETAAPVRGVHGHGHLDPARNACRLRLRIGGNESYPDLFQPYGGFPDSVRVENGQIVMPDLPGIGFKGKSNLIKVTRELTE